MAALGLRFQPKQGPRCFNDLTPNARMFAMILDDLLIALIIAGIGTSAAYLRAELLLHRILAKTEAPKKEA